jgi:phenylacetate-coenzyme A ligase PaaK-like adenylate-forming protein
MPERYWDPELETAPWKDVLSWQAARVMPFVRALPTRSAFHRTLLGWTRLPERAADLQFLTDLPFTTKDEIRRSQAERRPGEPFGRHQAVPLSAVIQTISSSGTTGEPVIFALTRADLEVWRDGIAAGFFTAGIRSDDVVAHLVGLP